MRRYVRLVPVFAADRRADLAVRIARQGINQTGGGFFLPGLDEKFRHAVRDRHEVTAQLFRQALQIRGDLVANHAGHQPVKARRIELIKQRQRHTQGDAIERMRGFKTIREIEIDLAHGNPPRELRLTDIGGRMAHQKLTRHVEQLGLGRLDLFAPLLEGRAVVYAGGHQRIIKLEQGLLIDQHIGTTRLVFEFANLCDQTLVMREKRRLGIEFTGGQPFADKHLACLDRIERAVMHAPPRY